MNDQERYRVLDATVKLHEKEGRPISGRELLDFYAQTTGDTIERPQFNQKLKELEQEGYLTAKFMDENNGSVSDVQYIVVTGDGNKLVVNKKASDVMPEPQTDFERDKKRFFNRIWSLIPPQLKPVIFIVLIISGSWGALKSFPKLSNYIGSNQVDTVIQQKNIDPTTDKFIAQQIWVETISNVETLKKQLEAAGKFNFRKKPVRFSYEAYNKNGVRISHFKAAGQIVNFYSNLKRMEGGTAYTRQMVTETIRQGTDVINLLGHDYSFKNYFRGMDSEAHAVSADLAIVDSPPFESEGDFSETKRQVV